jgi:hypothetical protein
MQKKIFFSCFSLLFLLTIHSPQKSYAVVNPLAVPNNKIGIHILFDSELPQAAQLVNSGGGDWGYVTIPIQAGDKDLVKWQTFMDNAKRLHVIPILRLATEGDYFNTSVWRKPMLTDIIDFANFLHSLNWPIKNRYVVVFNEVNRADEWGGSLNPEEYANLLSFAVTVFKSKSQDFFVISAGLDNAAPNLGNLYMNEYNYLQQMDNAVPGIFNQIDGFSSHSYPNPGFSQPPGTISLTGVGSFLFETQLIKKLSFKDLPVFITETGWSSEAVAEDLRAQYLRTTFDTIWNDNTVIAVTPFLLTSGAGPFQKFSFTRQDNSPSSQYQMLMHYPKIKGAPTIDVRVLSASTNRTAIKIEAPIVNFLTPKKPQNIISLSQAVQNVMKWLFKI